MLLPLVLTASPDAAIRLVGPTVRDRPVELLTCEACGRETVTRDLPPIGVDVAAVLEQLAEGGPVDAPAVSRQPLAPTCLCGARALTWSWVLTITVHAAGASMLGEVVSRPSMGVRDGNLSCGACSRSWDLEVPGLPAQVREAIGVFGAALSCGEVGWDE